MSCALGQTLACISHFLSISFQTLSLFAYHSTMDTNTTIAVLGCGNLGMSIAKGIVYAKIAPADKVVVTKRNDRFVLSSATIFSIL